MASIEQIIQLEVNPFDPVSFHTGNFWQEQQDTTLTVESIHQEVKSEITAVLDQVARDHLTRTLLLIGDRGCGKSYLLGRLKQKLNSKAFFAYIGPWAESDHIWRHILRYTVDSLMHVPEGQKQSQLLLWLNSLSAFKDTSWRKKILGERGLFISNAKSTYPAGIYQAKEFFGVLYDLTNPELYAIACDWLRGENLDEDDLKALGVRSAIDSEDAAQNILANFGRISADTQPIVLCFDQIDKVVLSSKGYIGLQDLFSVNTTIHNERLNNFLVIISLIKETWKLNKKQINEADKDRIYQGIALKPITLEQAEAVWEKRMLPLHQQATPKPESSIYPLTGEALEKTFPNGKTVPRYALQLGQRLIQKFKTGKDTPPDPVAAFKLVWNKEFNKTYDKISRIRQLSSPELIKMLQEAMEALQVEEITPRLLNNTKYAIYSFSYRLSGKSEKIGVVWSEEPSLQSFYHLMRACEKAMEQNIGDSLILIRGEKLGQVNNKGYKLYQQIFQGLPQRHITPHLDSVHYLATYHSLVNAACAGELVVGYESPNLEDLQALIRNNQILQECTLLQDLGIVPADNNKVQNRNGKGEKQLLEAKEIILSIVQTQHMLGRKTLIDNSLRQANVDELQVNKLIQQLAQEKKINLIGSDKKPEIQFVCLIPQT